MRDDKKLLLLLIGVFIALYGVQVLVNASRWW